MPHPFAWYDIVMATKKIMQKKGPIIYQTKSGAIELRGDFSNETLWATLDQIAVVFGRDKSVISRHLKNIFDEGELNKKSVVAKNATTAADGKVYQVEYYNLDAIISVGYRVNSTTATKFRQWATKTLRGYIVDGYAVNKKHIARNYEQFTAVVKDIQKLLPERSVNRWSGSQFDFEDLTLAKARTRSKDRSVMMPSPAMSVPRSRPATTSLR